jgi:hypothetical protein
MDSTMFRAMHRSSQGGTSVQDSEGESILIYMTGLSVQLDEDKNGQESGEEMKQQASDDEAKDTLARHTRSARASKSSKYVLPSAIIPDDFEEEYVDCSATTTLKGKPKNKYFRRVLWKLRLKKQTQGSAHG